MHIVVNTAYSILMHARYGQTIGKCVCKIKIIDHLTDTPINLNQAVLRDSGLLIGLLYAVAALKGEDIRPDELTLTGTAAMVAGIWFVLEIITMLLNKKRRALHDLIAGPSSSPPRSPKTIRRHQRPPHRRKAHERPAPLRPPDPQRLQ